MTFLSGARRRNIGTAVPYKRAAIERGERARLSETLLPDKAKARLEVGAAQFEKRFLG